MEMEVTEGKATCPRLSNLLKVHIVNTLWQQVRYWGSYPLWEHMNLNKISFSPNLFEINTHHSAHFLPENLYLKSLFTKGVLSFIFFYFFQLNFIVVHYIAVLSTWLLFMVRTGLCSKVIFHKYVKIHIFDQMLWN